jgi:hypothetical protein
VGLVMRSEDMVGVIHIRRDCLGRKVGRKERSCEGEVVEEVEFAKR